MNENKREEGLPDIGEIFGQKKRFVIVVIVIVLVLIGCMYWYQKADQPQAKLVEETYSVTNESQIEVKKPEQEVTDQQTASAEPAPTVNAEAMQQQIALIQEKQKELQQRLSAPLMLVNASQSSNANAVAQPSQSVSGDANTQFMNQVSAQTTATSVATHIGSLNKVIAEGSLIHAILESATNSDLPGYLRASVSEPVYSEDGTQVLIPKASRLIGQYKSGTSQGQSRIFIVWTRLITPEGFSIQLGSPGVDNLGVAGMDADEINRHFWQKFGTASLLSLLGAGAANVGVNGQDQNNSASSYREAVATSFAQSADQSLQQDSRIAPTLKTYQGKPIMVFVAKDLNFQSAMKTANPKLNVF